MSDDINLDAFNIHPLEHICPTCHLVHWTPTGASFCMSSD